MGPGPGAEPAGAVPGPNAGASRVGSRGARQRGKKLKRSLEFPLRNPKRGVLFFLVLPADQWLWRPCAGREVQAGQPELL